MIALPKKNQTNKCSDHRTISLISHTRKIVACILSKRLESKIEEVVEEDQFGFQKGKGTRDAIGLMRITSGRVLDIKEEMCLCFIDRHCCILHFIFHLLVLSHIFFIHTLFNLDTCFCQYP